MSQTRGDHGGEEAGQGGQDGGHDGVQGGHSHRHLQEKGGHHRFHHFLYKIRLTLQPLHKIGSD